MSQHASAGRDTNGSQFCRPHQAWIDVSECLNGCAFADGETGQCRYPKRLAATQRAGRKPRPLRGKFRQRRRSGSGGGSIGSGKVYRFVDRSVRGAAESPYGPAGGVGATSDETALPVLEAVGVGPAIGDSAYTDPPMEMSEACEEADDLNAVLGPDVDAPDWDEVSVDLDMIESDLDASNDLLANEPVGVEISDPYDEPPDTSFGPPAMSNMEIVQPGPGFFLDQLEVIPPLPELDLLAEHELARAPGVGDPDDGLNAPRDALSGVHRQVGPLGGI